MNNVIKTILIGLLFGVSFLSCIISSMITAYEAEHETNPFKFSFYVQRYLWNENDGVLNLAGKTIVTIVVTVFILPANILLFVCHVGMTAASAVWSGFKYLFAERRDVK